MKKSVISLALILTFTMLSSMFAVSVAADLGEPIDSYDDYGYYAYFDFENYGSASNHQKYMTGSANKNANGLLCNPFGFLMNQGTIAGTGKLLSENGNSYYRYTYSASGDYDVIGVFALQTTSGKNVIIADAAELNFKFRMADEQTAADTARLGLVQLRRGSTSGMAQHVWADIYGNIYALVNGTRTLVYVNGDGETVGGDGKFMDITFRWYDTTNTYSLYINGKAIVEAMPAANDYRATTHVTQTYNDDFGVESRKVVGGTSGNAGGNDRALELGRGNGGFVAEYDDIELKRLETAQHGAYYYANSFDGVYDGLSQMVTRNETYYFEGSPTSSNFYRSEADENGNRYLNITEAGIKFSLNDKRYQQFTQDNLVIDFKIKGAPTHTEGYKTLVRLYDSGGVNTIKVLMVDPNGNLYTEGKAATRIDGYKLDGSEWLNISIVAIKNRDNDGKFGSFNSSKKTSSRDNTYYFNYYINGEFVGVSYQTFREWATEEVYSSNVKSPGNGASYASVITDYTVGTAEGNVAALDLTNLTLVDGTTTANHKIYKTADALTYYDVTFDANGNQTAYSSMVLTAETDNRLETLRFLTDGSVKGMIDDIKVYAGTAPEWVYANANSQKGGTLLDVNFASAAFPTNAQMTSRTKNSGPDVLGSFITNNVVATSVIHKDTDGNTVTADTTRSSDYATVTVGNNGWFDYFIPMPEKIDGGYDFNYSFELTLKNIGFDSEDDSVPSSVGLLSNRFENTDYAAGWMMTVDESLNFYGGTKNIKLYNADGTQAKIKGNDWSTLRCDVHYYQTSSTTTLEFTYYLDGELLYLEDGNPAYRVTHDNIASAKMLAQFGGSNYRTRIAQMGSSTNITMDIKSLKVSKLNQSYTYESVDCGDIAGKVSVIELNAPSHAYDNVAGYHSLVSLEKTDINGNIYKNDLIIANTRTGELMLDINGERLSLLDANGNAIGATVNSVPLAIVYDDIAGDVRIFADYSPAYYDKDGTLTPVVDIAVDAEFAKVSGVVSDSVQLFTGIDGSEIGEISIDSYGLKSYSINDSDAAEIVGLQSNTLTEGIRIIAGLDTLYYSKVGFEMETFIGGASKGVKDVSDTVVYESVIADDKTITAKENGYNYLAAISITGLPEEYTADSYITLRSYTEIDGVKHYDDYINVVVTKDGYYFDKDGVIYQTTFNGTDTIPSEWKLDLGTGTNGSVSVTTRGEIEFKNPDATLNAFYLDRYIGSEYVFQADVTVTEMTSNSYFALFYGYENLNSFAYAYIKDGGYGKLQAYNGSWINTVDLSELAMPPVVGQTYTLTVVCTENKYASFFIDGVLYAEGSFANGYNTGKIGIGSKGMNLLIDNVIVRTAEGEGGSYILYEQDFNGNSALPANWNIVGNGGTNDKVGLTGDGKLRIIQPDGKFLTAIYNSDLTTNNYVVEADVTILDKELDTRYLGIVYRYTSATSFATAGIRINGAGWLEAKTTSSWNTFKSFQYKDENGNNKSLELNKTYTLTLICNGKIAAFYIDGQLVSCGSLPDGYESGDVGLYVSGLDVEVDNFVVKPASDSVVSQKVVYDLYSSELTEAALPASDWTVLGVNDANTITKNSDGKLVFNFTTANYIQGFLNKNIGYNSTTGTNDYIVEMKVNISSKMADTSNVGIYFRQDPDGSVYGKNPDSDFVYAAQRLTGRHWMQGQNTGNNWASAKDTPVSLKTGENTLKVVCIGDTAQFYVNNVCLIDGTNPSTATPKRWSEGIVGFGSNGVSLTLEEFKVSEYVVADTLPDIYHNENFDGTTTLPDDWKSANVQTGKAYTGLADYSKMRLEAYGDGLLRSYLNANVKNGDADVYDYIVETDVTIKDYETTGRYMGITFRQTGSTKLIFAGFRINGEGWIQTWDGTTWTNCCDKFNLSTNNITLKKDTTYKLKLICQGDTIKFYLDGTLLTEGAIPESVGTTYDTGTVGVASKGIDFDVESFVVKAVNTDGSEGSVLFEQGFNKIAKLSDAWNTAGTGTTYTVNLIHESALKLTSTTTDGSPVQAYWDTTPANNNYVAEADITIKDILYDTSYFGYVVRKSGSNAIYIGTRFNGAGWIEGNNSGSYSFGSFNLADKGITLQKNKTYRYKVVCEGDKVSFYIDGTLIAEGTNPKPEETLFDVGTVGFMSKGITYEVDNFSIKSIRDTSDALYATSFDGSGATPAEWKNEAGAARNGVVPSISNFIRSDKQDNGALYIKAMDSSLSVIALDKLLEYESFAYTADLTMLSYNTSTGISHYMGPVFGLQDDSSCSMFTFKVPEGTWNVETWLTAQKTNPADGSNWVAYDSGSSGTKALDTVYKLKVIGIDGYVTVYINGVEITKCKVDESCLTGRFGIAFRNAEILLDNVKITKAVDHYEVIGSGKEATRLRVASYNVGDFSTANGTAGGEIAQGNGTEVTKPEYINVFERVGADVWGLQEDSQYFNGTTKEDPYDAVYGNVLPYYSRNFTGGYNGKAFLSSYNVYDAKAIYYPAAVTSYAPEGTTAYGHPWFWTGKINVDGKEIALVSLHFDWACKERRFQQIESVIEFAKSNEYCIIIGDFNPENYINGTKITAADDIHNVNGDVNMYQVDWKMFTDAGFEPANGGRFGVFGTIVRGGVSRSPYPWDNVFVSSNIKILGAEMITEPWMNDHAIMVADLEIN